MGTKMTEQNKADRPTPLLKTINDFMKLVKGFMALVFIAYLFSGITLIQPDEVGVILRMGKLAGDTPLDQVHEPGWLFAFPKPFDSVIKIPVKRILEVPISELAARPDVPKDDSGNISTIDPTREGYCISADENIFQTKVIVKYQITDPIKTVFGYNNPLRMSMKLIHDLTVAEMISVSCRFSIDGLLTKDKKELSEQVKDGVQKKLDDNDSGLTIVSLEIAEMIPPPFLAFDFEDVQSAFVDKHQYINKAKSRRETKLPEAQSSSEEKINSAYAYSESITAQAIASASQFTKMLEAYEANSEEVSIEMKNKVLKSVVEKSGNIIVFPDTKESKSNVSLILGTNGSIQSTITTPDGYYIGED